MLNTAKMPKKRAKDLMLVLDLGDTIDRLTMVYCVHWHGYVMRVECSPYIEEAGMLEAYKVYDGQQQL